MIRAMKDRRVKREDESDGCAFFADMTGRMTKRLIDNKKRLYALLVSHDNEKCIWCTV
jgi:hypothetical protein